MIFEKSLNTLLDGRVLSFSNPDSREKWSGNPGKKVYVLIDLLLKNDHTYSKKFKIIIGFRIIPECSTIL